ncbi:MAG: TlpA disulfide reductase family protein [Chitinophagaceae bacterium]
MKNYFILIALSISCATTVAQVSSDTAHSSRKIIYILPDGSILENNKLDSLYKAWGQDRVAVVHTKEDDEKGIIHLVRITDEMMQKSKADDDRSKEIFDAMLNKPAPDFTLTDLQGDRWSLKKLRGKIVVLNFWFTTCGPCIREMPELNKLVELYDNKNFVFLGLTYNNAEEARTFLEKRSFRYTLLPGSGKVDEKYRISSWPTSIVIDRNGYVKMIINSDPKIREKLEAVINSLK